MNPHMAHRMVAIILATALGAAATSLADAATQKVTAKHGRVVSATRAHGPKGARPKFRGSRGAAAAEARRLGAVVGQGCNGKANMPRNEHQTVVLCSDGKTFLVDTPAGQPGTRAVECSLAGTGPQPACFGE